MGNIIRENSWLGMAQLRYVEEIAWWNGVVSRREVVEKFGVSAQQGSAIIQKYLELNPKSMNYCLKRRRYLVNPKMKCILNQLEIKDELKKDDVTFAEISQPVIEINPKVKRFTMVAIRQQLVLKVKYQSRSKSDPEWREIAPHAIGDDGVRLHVRAWCFINKTYRDFSLLRIKNVKWPENPIEDDLPLDTDWDEIVELRFHISDRLDEGTRQSLVEDYGLNSAGEDIVISCRRAMKPYVMHRMGLHEESGLPTENFFSMETEKK